MAKKRLYRKNKDLEATREARWQERFRELKTYKHEHGDCNVPSVWPEDQRLSNWVKNQRHDKRYEVISKQREIALEGLGVSWKLTNAPRVESWDSMLARLRRFKKRFGHCDVSEDWRDDPRLGRWVRRQRYKFSEGELAKERIEKLERLGFCWDLKKAWWQEQFDALEEFKKRHGHCRVPSAQGKLSNWVMVQRACFRQGGMSKGRIERLDALGFIWDVYEEQWQARVSELKVFKRQHGHTCVPKKYPENPALGNWVHNLRCQKRRKELRRVRVIELNRLGFEWY